MPALPCGHLLGCGGNIALRGLFQLADAAVEVDETLGHDVRQVLLVEVVGGVDGLVVDAHHFSRDADGGAVGGQVLEHHAARADAGVVADIHRTQHLGACADKDIVAQGGVTLAGVLAGAAEGHAVVDKMGKKNDIVIRTIPLIPKHDLRAIHGSYMEVTARTFYQGTATDDYVQITLTDEEDIPDGMQKLRTIYPNLLGLSYDNLRTRTQQTIDFDSKIKQKSEKQLFEELYEKQNNQPMSIEQKQFVEELFTRLQEDKS